MSWTVELMPQGALSLERKNAILAAMAQEWPEGFQGELTGRDWIHPDDAQPHNLSILEQGQLRACCSLMHKEIHTELGLIRLNGLSGVLCLAPYRNQGWGKKLLHAATQALGDENCDASVLSCAPDLVPYYASQGWMAVPHFTLWVGSAEHKHPDLEPFMVRPWTDLGEKWFQSLAGGHLWFGDYSW